MRRRRVAAGFALLLGLLSGGSATPADAARQGSGWYPMAGLTWMAPTDSGIRDIYGSGLGFSAGMGYAISPRWQIEVALDRTQRSGPLSTPPFARDAHGELTLTPVLLDLRFSPFSARTRPFLRVGGGFLFASERVEYRLLEARSSVEGTRTDGVAVFGAGIDAVRERWHYRITASGSLGPKRREVLRGDGRTSDAPGGVRATFWSLAASVAHF